MLTRCAPEVLSIGQHKRVRITCAMQLKQNACPLTPYNFRRLRDQAQKTERRRMAKHNVEETLTEVQRFDAKSRAPKCTQQTSQPSENQLCERKRQARKQWMSLRVASSSQSGRPDACTSAQWRQRNKPSVLSERARQNTEHNLLMT